MPRVILYFFFLFLLFVFFSESVGEPLLRYYPFTLLRFYASALRAQLQRHVMAGLLADIKLAWPADLLLRIGNHLFPLGDPAAVRPKANSTVNIEGGKPSAFKVMPE